MSAFRWRMIGHTLRGTEDNPAYLSILFAINADTDVINFEGRLGRPCLNLLDMIRKDLKRKNICNSLQSLSISDFETLRAIAFDRVEWKSFEKL